MTFSCFIAQRGQSLFRNFLVGTIGGLGFPSVEMLIHQRQHFLDVCIFRVAFCLQLCTGSLGVEHSERPSSIGVLRSSGIARHKLTCCRSLPRRLGALSPELSKLCPVSPVFSVNTGLKRKGFNAIVNGKRLWTKKGLRSVCRRCW